MKKILFVINTLGRAGAETALIELLTHLDREQYRVYLYVLTGQGELFSRIPEGVILLNQEYDHTPVLSKEGLKLLTRNLLRKSIRQGVLFFRLPYLIKNTAILLWKRKFSFNKLTRCLMADTGDRFTEHFDLAVAYLEGGASSYVQKYVKADKKVAFIHVDYEKAGYNRSLDENCYLEYDHIFTVSQEVREVFLNVYPECSKKISVFHNLINRNRILEMAEAGRGFEDGYEGFRILTVGRLYAQKAFEISIEAMKLLKQEGYPMRWYVLGEGDERQRLERLIEADDLKEDFILAGSVQNPYPYFKQCDLYVHASRFEGKSIAIQEAQVLGCPIIVSDCSGNREQVKDGVDGLLCDLTPQAIKEAVIRLYRGENLRQRLAQGAAERPQVSGEELRKLYQFL